MITMRISFCPTRIFTHIKEHIQHTTLNTHLNISKTVHYIFTNTNIFPLFLLCTGWSIFATINNMSFQFISCLRLSYSLFLQTVPIASLDYARLKAGLGSFFSLSVKSNIFWLCVHSFNMKNKQSLDFVLTL